MSTSASSLDPVNARRQRMWASGDDAVYQADGSGYPRTPSLPDGRSSRTAATSTWPPNEGSSPVELNAIFLACTGIKEFLAAVTQPKGCHV